MSIWAPEMHAHKGRYYLFLTFDSRDRLDSGKLAGPWSQQNEPVFAENGGHGMLFKTFEGALMMVLHAPNNMNAQPRIFKMEDTGETLRVVSAFTESNH